MPIKFRCEHCRQLLGISQTKAGQMVDCPTCGRAVRVPSLDGKSDPISAPKWDPQDQSLVNALNALASLTEAPAVEPGSTAADSDQAPPSPRSVPQPVAVAIPEPIDLPPLEAPVVLPEPMMTAEAKQPPVKGELAPDAEPWSKLAALSVAEPKHQPLHPDRTHEATVSPSASGRGVTLPIALLLVGMAFLLGFFVGKSRNVSPPATDTAAAGHEEPGPDANIPQAQAPTAEPSRRRAVEGRITYLTETGSSQSDTGAIVIVLPAYRNSSTRLPIVGFRPADSAEDRELAQAMIKALGGDLSVVDDKGLYSCNLPQAGEYHLLILSRHLERPANQSFENAAQTTLGAYFDRPQQLVGQLRYHLSEVSYRGETPEIRDHSFGHES